MNHDGKVDIEDVNVAFSKVSDYRLLISLGFILTPAGCLLSIIPFTTVQFKDIISWGMPSGGGFSAGLALGLRA